MHQLVELLTLEDGFPAAAVAQCQENLQTVLPDLLELVEQAADGPIADDANSDRVFFAIHILAAAREPRLFPPLVRLLRREETTEPLDDAIGGTLAKIIINCFDGDVDALFALLRDSGADPFVRNDVFAAVAFLTWEGRIDRTVMHDFLARYDDENVLDEDERGWEGWMLAIRLLGFAELTERVERAFPHRIALSSIMAPEEFRAALTAAQAAEPGNSERFEAEDLGYLGDLAEELAWLNRADEDDEDDDEGFDFGGSGFTPPRPKPPASFTEQQRADYLSGRPVTNPLRNVGRNDPCPCGSGKKYKRCCGAAAG